ncbi:hypothetical protein FPOA_12120 [Fusarium poae]|uniref:Mitochondrial division protein 1 n=1 Tax=Fusarium poae TaxID=36050 RepID=A0A1B8AA81_FUSPO|nr:hypothetical protein FPOA_12120 [Fusarium poae]
MAEALGVASGVIAVVDMSAKVVNWCVRYAQDVSHAKEDKTRLVEEVTRLNLASVNARNLLDGPGGSKLKASHALLLATDKSRPQLQRIESQLAAGTGQGKGRLEALRWPFKSKDVQVAIRDIRQCTEAIYSALEIDQTLVFLLQLTMDLTNDNSASPPDLLDEQTRASDPTRVQRGCSTVQRLTQLAVPLFIFAATVCHFIDDRNRNSPRVQLRKVLDYGSKGHVSQLDRTYGPVLDSLIADVSEDGKEEIIKDFKMIVGSIVMLANPLSVSALSQLLEVDPEAVDNRLDTLHSVLSVPPRRKEPVRLLQLSFLDYPITKESEFRVDKRHAHQTLAKHCLRVMWGGLRENICGLSFPGMRRSTVDSSELEEHIPAQVQYACMYWVYHQMEGDPGLNDSEKVYDFLTTHFLHWLEAMSLLGRVKECLDSLRSLARWLENREDSSLLAFVADAVRFVQLNFSVIAEAPLQVYCCLAFAPSKSIARKIFENAIPKWRATATGSTRWCSQGHSQIVHSLVFSHDSKKIASGSETVRIWDTETGECKQVLQGHSDEVNSVVFSHDSKKIAAASKNMTVRIWDAKMGACERVLEGHDDYSHSLVVSHDSKKVASGSSDETVRIWDAETGECKQVLQGQDDEVDSVVFSHDSKKVVSSSSDKKIRIWDVETGRCKNGFSLDRYAGVLSFTPDERGIVTNRGTFALPDGSQASAEFATAWRCSKAAILTCIDDTWVVVVGKDQCGK